MNFSVALLSVLAGLALASPGARNANDAGPLAARVDCSTCGCSSAESCTVTAPPPLSRSSSQKVCVCMCVN